MGVLLLVLDLVFADVSQVCGFAPATEVAVLLGPLGVAALSEFSDHIHQPQHLTCPATPSPLLVLRPTDAFWRRAQGGSLLGGAEALRWGGQRKDGLWAAALSEKEDRHSSLGVASSRCG